MKEHELVVGEQYKCAGDSINIQYLGKAGNWYQFAEVGKDVVWMEVLATDLFMLKTA